MMSKFIQMKEVSLIMERILTETNQVPTTQKKIQIKIKIKTKDKIFKAEEVEVLEELEEAIGEIMEIPKINEEEETTEANIEEEVDLVEEEAKEAEVGIMT